MGIWDAREILTFESEGQIGLLLLCYVLVPLEICKLKNPFFLLLVLCCLVSCFETDNTTYLEIEDKPSYLIDGYTSYQSIVDPGDALD